jgi:Protein of unknown function (DUF4236)
MNLRFRRRLKILPGLWVNFNKGMPSISAGGGPFTLNVSCKGIRGTASLHGRGVSLSETIPWPKLTQSHTGRSSNGFPTKPTQPPGPSLDEMDRLATLRVPLDEAMNRNDWGKACELLVEKIKLAEQMLDFARRYGPPSDVNNCVRRVELYRETYSQVAAEANHPMPSICVLPPEPEPEERDAVKAGQKEFARLLECPDGHITIRGWSPPI